jgi:hypothetical protein
MRPSALCLAASLTLGLAASSLGSAGAAVASGTSPASAAHRATPHVKKSAHDRTRTSAKRSPQLQPYACGTPTLVSSTGGTVKVGVVDEHTLTYGVTLDDSCLGPDVGNVVIYIYQDSGSYYSEDATYMGNDRAGNQIWQSTFTFDPSLRDPAAYWLDSISYAGTWHTGVQVPGTTRLYNFAAADSFVQRWSTLSVNASEPTPAGATETVTGSLKRANWDDGIYHGYTVQPAQLQFRTLTGSYGTLKTATTDLYGNLKTTTTATVDGCYRWTFAGTTTTPPATAVGDCVDVT